MLTPPISSEFHAFSGGFIAVGRAIGATVLEGWLTAAPLLGEVSVGSGVPGDESMALEVPLSSGGGFTMFGLVIGMADLVTVLEAIALARAR